MAASITPANRARLSEQAGVDRLLPSHKPLKRRYDSAYCVEDERQGSSRATLLDLRGSE
jgi:hypothetical protein